MSPRAAHLYVGLADLRRRPGSRKDVEADLTIGPIEVVDSRVPAGSRAHVKLTVESSSDGVVVTGTVDAPWQGECRRCLATVDGQLHADVRELFAERPIDEETWAIDGDPLDLAPLVAEVVTLELPLVPLCRVDCAGLCPECGANRNDVACGHADR